MRLREYLRRQSPTLFSKVEHLVETATPQLWHSYGTFPSGTRHTPEHTEQVESIAGKLLNDDLLHELGPDEIALLILACHFHDLGMAGTENDNLTYEGRERVRREHAVSIGDRIMQHWRQFGFSSETEAEVLAEICKGHRPKRIGGTATWDNLPKHRILGPDRDVRVRLVAAIVYAADELHIGEDRAPRREEEFIKIESAASRPHWRRHQAIQGPVLRNGSLCFDGIVCSPLFELDLRKTLKKAFGAVSDLNSQLQLEKLSGQTNAIEFTWQRERAWALLIATLCSDLNPRAECDLIDGVNLLFQSAFEEWVDLSELCNESDTKESRSRQISAVIENLVAREFLTASGDGLMISLDSRTATHVFNIAKIADDAELHFPDANRSQHENRIYQSAYGRRFVSEILKPTFEEKFSIDLSSPGEALHLRAALESSPTAARIAQLMNPPESVLVQSDLFRFACIAGVCSDLIDTPEAILNAEYRHAVDALFDGAAERLPKFLLFVKELAIIRKLSYEQVAEATAIAAEAPKSEGRDKADSDRFELKVTQQIPKDRPEWSLGHILLARARAGIEIAIKNTPLAPLRITGLSSTAGTGLLECAATGTSHIIIKTGPPTPVATSSFRGTLSINDDDHTIRLELGRLKFDESSRPVLLQFTMTSPITPGGTGTATCKLSFIATAMTVGDHARLAQAVRLICDEDWTIVSSIDGNPLSSMNNLNIGDISRDIDELYESLNQVDPGLPVPLFITEDHARQIIKSKGHERKQVTDNILAELLNNRPTATTLFLRYGTPGGFDYYEEYLGIAPLGFGFKAVRVRGDGKSQDEIDNIWKSGSMDVKIESSFREELEELANEFRTWSKDPMKEFPVKLNSDLPFYYCKTRLTMTFHRVVDRGWYLERRVVFGLRPVLNSERYSVEADYWRSMGDSDRAQLLHELFQKALENEAAAGPVKVPPTKP